MTLTSISNRLGVAAPTVAGEVEGDSVNHLMNELITKLFVEQAPGYARVC